LINDSWEFAICMTLTSPSTSPNNATVIKAEMLKNSLVRNFMASLMPG
jgi:hypothetical protein